MLPLATCTSCHESRHALVFLKVGITRSDLEAIDDMARAHPKGRRLPALALMARDQMNKFRHGNYELWCKLYPVPPEHNAMGSMAWFDHLPGGVISHP